MNEVYKYPLHYTTSNNEVTNKKKDTETQRDRETEGIVATDGSGFFIGKYPGDCW